MLFFVMYITLRQLILLRLFSELHLRIIKSVSSFVISRIWTPMQLGIKQLSTETIRFNRFGLIVNLSFLFAGTKYSKQVQVRHGIGPQYPV